MPLRLFNLPALARAAGFIAAASLIAGVTLAPVHRPKPARPASPAPAGVAEPPAPTLRRCQALAQAVDRDPACRIAWAVLRERFLGAAAPADRSSEAGPRPAASSVRP
jgi:conjugative transfer region protein TrbK